jgi:hypothetical protein
MTSGPGTPGATHPDDEPKDDMTPDELATKLAAHLNAIPLNDQDGPPDKIEGEPAVGIEIDGELFFLTVQEP